MATQATRSVLIENAMYRTLLATCGSTEMKCINKVSLNCEASCLWCHQESNRGHKASFLRPVLCSTNKAPRREQKRPAETARLLCLWCHQESNRGHKAKFLRPVLCSINKNAPQRLRGVSKVVPPGIEPGTQGFSVLCSTN